MASLPEKLKEEQLEAKTGSGARNGINARARAITLEIPFDLILLVMCLRSEDDRSNIS